MSAPKSATVVDAAARALAALKVSGAPKVTTEVKETTTTNGMKALTSTGSPCLDLFFSGMVRKAPKEKVDKLMFQSWAEDPQLAVKIVMQARDARGGKGEKLVVYHALEWLRRYKPATYLSNLREFLNLGYYRDLLQLAVLADAGKLPKLGKTEVVELELLAEDLLADDKVVQAYLKEVGDTAATAAATTSKADDDEKKSTDVTKASISLAAKWAPSEKKSFDGSGKGRLAKRVAALCFPSSKTPQKDYRKMLSRCRKHIAVLERFLCANDWESINFAQVPSRAHNLYRKAFQKHQPERYAKYLTAVSQGKADIKAGGVGPHELVQQYWNAKAKDDTIEAQWGKMLQDLMKSGGLQGAISVCDVSGSMTGTPMNVAIALSLMVAHVNEGAFHNRVISFHQRPSWHIVKEDTSFYSKVAAIRRMPWGMNTNIIAVFDLLLGMATKNKVPNQQMPRTLFIFSDMQFDVAVHNANLSAMENIKLKYKQAGYAMPNIVFWNIQGKTSNVPVTVNEAGVALVSGFSQSLLSTFMDPEVDFSPMAILRKMVAKYTAVIDDSDK